MARILIVEDELHLAQGLLFNLEAEGHQARMTESAETAWELLQTNTFDALLLDVMLPGISGFELCERLREANNFVPVLMLTARSRPEDVLHGFTSGADDYLPKPFELRILIARLHGLLRRMQWQRRDPAASTLPSTSTIHAAAEPAAPPAKPASPASDGNDRPAPANHLPAGQLPDDRLPEAPPHELFRFDGRTLDFDTLELETPAGRFRLTLMEASLLRYFIAHRNQNVSRKQILDEVWGLHEDTDTRAIDNFIVRLRRYIEDAPATPRFLITVRGVGYRFLPE